MKTNISIIGLGLIGGSIAKGLKKTDPDILISAYDKYEVLEKALDESVIDIALSSMDEALKSKLIFLCLPVEQSISALKKLAPHLKKEQILTDVGSVKHIFHKTWNEISSEGIYIGGHPMTGKEKNGYENSDPLLFQNSVYVLTREHDESDLDENLLRIVKNLGARVSIMEPVVHDLIMARVSHMPQLLSISLINSVANGNSSFNLLDFAAGGFRDMTRIASSSFEMWESILKYNRKETINALERYIEEISRLKNYLEIDNYRKIHEAFNEARMSRDEIPKNQKGFLFPLYDVYVFAEDKPGILNTITRVLYDEDINIKDIELLKIREGTGGTFRLSFGTEEDAKAATKILRNNEFTVS